MALGRGSMHLCDLIATGPGGDMLLRSSVTVGGSVVDIGRQKRSSAVERQAKGATVVEQR